MYNINMYRISCRSSNDERLAYANDIMNEIEDSADNPLNVCVRSRASFDGLTLTFSFRENCN